MVRGGTKDTQPGRERGRGRRDYMGVVEGEGETEE